MMQSWNILLISVLGASLLLATAVGKGDSAIASGPKGETREEVNTKPRAYTEVAQKGKTVKATETGSSGAPAKNESDSEADQVTPSKDKKSAPFKDFVPSEKIAGDSAVDFPVDI